MNILWNHNVPNNFFGVLSQSQIDERVQASLKSLEIRVFRHSRLVGWRLRDERVAYVRLLTRMHAYQLRAFALFYYGTRDIDLHTFKGRIWIFYVPKSYQMIG